MRRTVLSSLALACTAVLASAAPSLAHDGRPSPTAAPSQEPRPTPSKVPGTPTAAPAQRPVTKVPQGAPDTGVVTPSDRSGTDGLLIGSGAAVVLAGGATVLVVRRRRATGA